MKSNPVSLRRAGPVDPRPTLRVVQWERINASRGHNRPSPRPIAQLQVGGATIVMSRFLCRLRRRDWS